MIKFDVRCDVLEPITATDSAGNEVTIPQGRYHLMGIDHLVHKAAGGVETTGTDIRIVDAEDGKKVFSISPETLAHYITLDDVEVAF